MRYVSLFSGIEAASVAFEAVGMEPMAFSEIEPFPCAVLAARFPHVPNLGDVSKVDWGAFTEEHGRPDLVVGGSPCFPSGTLVLTEQGYMPIEEVRVGDLVVTHRGRLRPVLANGSRVADTVMLRAGETSVECTPNHPFLSRADATSVSEWVAAGDMGGREWMHVCRVDAPVPEHDAFGNLFGGAFAYLVCAFVAHGAIDEDSEVMLSCPADRAAVLARALDRLGLFAQTWDMSSGRVRFALCSRVLRDWFAEHVGAARANVPAWCLALPDGLRRELVGGYLDATGEDDALWEQTERTASLGMGALERSLDETGVGWWEQVESIEPCRKNVTVYNMEVADDNSYTANGLAVHNCQSFSVAGTRTGLDGASGLMWEYIRAVRELKPKWVLWENVPGALSSNGGRDFGCLLSSLEECGYPSIAWRILDSQYFGVAQRRRRLFVVASATEGGAEQVLFEPESLRGDNPSSREKRKALARAAGRDPACEGEGSLNAWDVQSKRVFSENGVAPTLSSGTSEGANIQPSVLQHADTIAFKYSAGAAARTMPTYNDGTCNTLTADYHAPAVAFAQNIRNEVRLQGGDGTVVGALGASGSAKGQGVPFVMATGQANAEVTEDMTPTLNCAHEQPIAVSGASTQYGDEVAGTLTARADSSPCADRGQNVVCMADDNAKADGKVMCQRVESLVRRLTPTECERLQDFPDGWTDLTGWRYTDGNVSSLADATGKTEKQVRTSLKKWTDDCPDGPRYKAIGNSMTTSVMRWLGMRIDAADRGDTRLLEHTPVLCVNPLNTSCVWK